MQTSTVMKKLSTATATAAFICLGSAGTALAASLYTVNDLGTLGGPALSGFPEFSLTDRVYSVANDINNKGQVVGWSYNSNLNQRAFVWENGKMTEFHANPLYRSSAATAINEAGHVVGWTSGGNHANQIPFGGGGSGFNGHAYGINNKGVVVGRYATFPQPRTTDSPTGFESGFVYDNGKETNLSMPSYGEYYGATAAYDVNDAGQVVGASSIIGGFLWENGKMKRIGIAGHKINNKGQVMGSSSLWENGKITNLGISAKDINEKGVVVGTSLGGGSQHAYLWENGSAIDLNDLLPENLGWELTEARGINDLGQIVGIGKINSQYGTAYRSFLLNPIAGSVYEPTKSVPEPVSALGLLTFGVLGVGAITKRQRQHQA